MLVSLAGPARAIQGPPQPPPQAPPQAPPRSLPRLEVAPTVKPSSLSGVVKDSLGEPIAYATVYTDAGVAATANDSGRFFLPNVPAGRATFNVRRMGYRALDFHLDMPEDTTVLVSIRLHRVVQRMREVTVEEKMTSMALYRSGFYERQKAGVGYFMLPFDIAEKSPRRIEELLYGVPGVTVSTNNGRPVAYGISPKGYCRLTVFLDGRRFAVQGDSELLIDPHDVKAAEVYPRALEAPPQFHDPDNPFCGVLVLWTRVD
jgi:carboxypeptidase family protein